MLYLIIGMLLIISSNRLIQTELKQVEQQSHIRDWILIAMDTFMIIAGATFIVIGSLIFE